MVEAGVEAVEEEVALHEEAQTPFNMEAMRLAERADEEAEDGVAEGGGTKTERTTPTAILTPPTPPIRRQYSRRPNLAEWASLVLA